MKTIMMISPKRNIVIKIPLFGRIKWEEIKPKRMTGERVDLLIMDEVISK